jgi:hypothetical protein
MQAGGRTIHLILEKVLLLQYKTGVSLIELAGNSAVGE